MASETSFASAFSAMLILYDPSAIVSLVFCALMVILIVCSPQARGLVNLYSQLPSLSARTWAVNGPGRNSRKTEANGEVFPRKIGV